MELKSITELAAETGFSRDQLHWLIRRGRLAAVQPGGPKGKMYVNPQDLKSLWTQPVQRGAK